MMSLAAVVRYIAKMVLTLSIIIERVHKPLTPQTNQVRLARIAANTSVHHVRSAGRGHERASPKVCNFTGGEGTRQVGGGGGQCRGAAT
jgi:hypothetical protein